MVGVYLEKRLVIQTPTIKTGTVIWYMYINFVYLQVADGALKCFASLADRFIRKGVDPAPLAENGLTTELLCRLSQASLSKHNVSVTGTPGLSCNEVSSKILGVTVKKLHTMLAKNT